ncbi:MAG: efflux RND transporter periplasmic adaptor subunit [Paludibacter sp.]|nr:efflux RND transporter periplasmic adaptor subunit [Paludibacter sp.]
MKNNLVHIFIGGLIIFTMAACSSSENKKNISDNNQGRKIIETGELKAVDVRAFVLKRYGRYWYRMKIIGLCKQGEIVHSGDSIIQLDPSEIKKYIVDVESDLETQKATIAKLLVDQSNRRSELQSNLKNELASFDLKKLELQSTRFESEKTRKIKELEFKQAEINIKKVKRQVELYEIIAKNDLKVQQVREKQLETQLRDANEILPSLTIRTPIDGIFQVGRNNQNGQTLKIGDEIYTGNMMGNVPDLKWMKVNTYVNENDFLRVKEGQKVIVRLDALPKMTFDGVVSYVGKFCHLKEQKSKQKVFDVEIRMLKPDERLKPGMTVSCEYLEK